HSTYARWVLKGQKGLEPYRGFCEALTRAAEEAQVRLVERIEQHSIGDWRAAAFILERRNKKDWGRHETIDATITSKADEDLERRLLKGREGDARGETR